MNTHRVEHRRGDPIRYMPRAWLKYIGFWPWLILIASLAITYHLWKIERDANLQRLQRDFEFRVRESTERVEQRLLSYEQILRGARGLFAASVSVERDEFRTYIATQHIDERHPGVQGIGFSLIVPAAQKDSHIAAIRKETFREDIPEYRIWPEGQRSIYTSIVYLEPFSGRNLRAFGYDMYAEKVRRAAMEQARDTGKASISGKVTLVQETGKDVQAGFLMYLPIYRNGTLNNSVDERRADIVGWAYAVFRMNDLMNGIMGERSGDLNYKIYDGGGASAENLMFDSDKAAGNSETSQFQASRRIDIAGHQWTMLIGSNPSFEARLDMHRTTLIAEGGIVVSLLLTLLTWLLVTGRVRALTLAQEMTSALKQSEQIQRQENEKNLALLHNASDGVHIFDAAGNLIEVSDSFCAMLGYRREEMIGMNVVHWDAKLSDIEITQTIGQLIASGQRSQFETRHRRKDGSIFDVEISTIPLTLDGIQVLFNSSRDITERKQAEALRRKSAEEIEDLYNLAPCGYHSLDKDGIIRRINDTELAWLGYTRDELVGKVKWLALLTPASQQIFRDYYPVFKAQGFVRNLEYEIVRKDGTIFIGILSATAIFDQHGDYMMSRSTLLDITGRKRMEEDVQQHLLFAESLNKIARSIAEHDEPSLILEDTVSIVGNVLGIDRALIYDISLEKQQVIGKSEWLNPRHPDITPTKSIYPISLFIGGTMEMWRTRSWLTSRRDQINPHLLADGSGEILHNKMMIKSLLWYPFAFYKDGYFLLTLNQIYSDQEWSTDKINFLDSVSQLVDVALAKIRMIAERKQAEEDLRIAATAFETDECIMITDKNANIVRVNRAFTELTGYAAAEVIGKNPSLFHSGRQDAAFYSTMWKALSEDKFWQGEIWNRRKSGDIYPEWLTITGVTDDQGSLTHYVAVFSDITQRKLDEEKISFLAYHDKLTGMPNRTLFYDRLSLAMSHVRRNGGRFALLFVDLDGFKAVNDGYGHDAGDEVLKVTAKRLMSCVRDVDTVARLGGDEFAIVLGEIAQPADISVVAEKIIQKAMQPVLLHDDRKCNVGASIGIAIYPDDGTEIDSLVGAADAAMYQSKSAGKGTYTFSSKQGAGDAENQPWMAIDETYLLGIPEMDRQDIELAQLLNKLNASVKNSESVLELERVFDEYILKMRSHFEDEERLMDLTGYNGDMHKHEHQRMLAEADELRRKFFRGGEFVVLQSLKGWLLSHVLHFDRELAGFLAQHRPD